MRTPILFIDHAERLGGAEKSLLLLVQHLDAALWQPHLACPPGDLAESAQQLGIPWHEVSLPQLRGAWRVGLHLQQSSAALAKAANEIGAAAMVANTVRAAFYTFLAAKRAKRPFIWHMRDFWLSESQPRYPQIDTFFKKALCRGAAQVIANSAATAQHLPCPTVSVVHNGLNLAKFAQQANGATFRLANGIPLDAPLVGIVGRLRPWKGQHHFIEMAAIVVESLPQTHFLIVGGSPLVTDNDYPKYLTQLAADKNIINQMTFTGHLDDVGPALAALDLFVHSGDPEPFGLVNIEAMAANKPVVAFAHGALPEIVVSGATGFLVPPYNVAALAEAVLKLLRAPEQSKKMGIAGRQRVKAQFSIGQTAVHISAILKQVTAGAL
jgi:glycosyltransferase involved in cell wall biosynthesis